MAYDLHLVRTSNWLDAADAPVTKEDVDALLLSDAELAWSMDYIEMKLEGEAKRFHLIEWKGQPFFLVVQGPNQVQQLRSRCAH